MTMRPASALPLMNVQQDVQSVLMESSGVGFLGDAADPRANLRDPDFSHSIDRATLLGIGHLSLMGPDELLRLLNLIHQAKTPALSN